MRTSCLKTLLLLSSCRLQVGPAAPSFHFVHVHGCDWLFLLNSHTSCWLTAGMLMFLPVLQLKNQTDLRFGSQILFYRWFKVIHFFILSSSKTLHMLSISQQEISPNWPKTLRETHFGPTFISATIQDHQGIQTCLQSTKWSAGGDSLWNEKTRDLNLSR